MEYGGLAAHRERASAEEEGDPLISLIGGCTVLLSAAMLGWLAFTLYKTPMALDIIVGGWTLESGYALATFLASSLPLLFVHWLSPWSETLWDYAYLFTAACAYNYMVPACTFAMILLAQSLVGGGITRILDWNNLLTLVSMVTTGLLISITMQVYSVKERRLETRATTTSPITFVLMQVTTALLAYRTMQLSATLPVLYYLATLPAVITYALTWLALLTYVAASKSNPLWLIAAAAASAAGIIMFSSL
jgi:hypothetical protein